MAVEGGDGGTDIVGACDKVMRIGRLKAGDFGWGQNGWGEESFQALPEPLCRAQALLSSDGVRV